MIAAVRITHRITQSVGRRAVCTKEGFDIISTSTHKLTRFVHGDSIWMRASGSGSDAKRPLGTSSSPRWCYSSRFSCTGGPTSRWRSSLSCDIHTHTPARMIIQNPSCTILLYKVVLQTLLGMDMGMNVTAQSLHPVRITGTRIVIDCPGSASPTFARFALRG